jgi:hypothetical protein
MKYGAEKREEKDHNKFKDFLKKEMEEIFQGKKILRIGNWSFLNVSQGRKLFH